MRCRSFDNSGICNCVGDGKIINIRYGDGQWCCHSNDCKVVKYVFGTHGPDVIVQCNGTALGLNQQCHNGDKTTPSCNHYATDDARNEQASRSYIDICHDQRYEFLLLKIILN